MVEEGPGVDEGNFRDAAVGMSKIYDLMVEIGRKTPDGTGTLVRMIFCQL